jgi:Winged helix DNA-binding domain
MTVKVSEAHRRARLVSRHRLSIPAATVTVATEAMVALHATDPVTVYLSARARVPAATAGAVDDALYAERGIVRMLGMRRTMFVVPAALLPVVQQACTDDVARRLRRQLERDLGCGGIGDGDAATWLRELGDSALRALAARGSATGAQLSADEPRLRTQLVYVPDKSYGGAANITSRVLVLLAAEGHMIRGHRRGGWSSGQFEWCPPAAWLAGGTASAGHGTAPDGSGQGAAGSGTAGEAGSGSRPGSDGAADAAAARAELARRWLRTFGPAPVSDLQWWAGWTGAQTKAALTALPVCEVDLDGQPGVMLAGDEEFDEEPAPVAALLPALDPTPMGWQARGWFLGPHGPALFDRTGNIGPTVWWEGRIVGGWAQRASGEVVIRLLEDIGADGAAAVAAETARLEAWLGSARITPRFRTPLERELSA